MSDEMKNATPMDDSELEKVTGGAGSPKNKLRQKFFKCDFCGEIFTSKKALKSHIKSLHKG